MVFLQGLLDHVSIQCFRFSSPLGLLWEDGGVLPREVNPSRGFSNPTNSLGGITTGVANPNSYLGKRRGVETHDIKNSVKRSEQL